MVFPLTKIKKKPYHPVTSMSRKPFFAFLTPNRVYKIVRTNSGTEMKWSLWPLLGSWSWTGEHSVWAKAPGNPWGFAWGKRVGEHLSNYRKQALFWMLTPWWFLNLIFFRLAWSNHCNKFRQSLWFGGISSFFPHLLCLCPLQGLLIFFFFLFTLLFTL